jgi:chorismate mutase
VNLPEADKRKITGILGMLASAHDGERASAALLLTRLLAKHGARPEELLNGKANGNGYAVGTAREIATLRANLLSANNHVRDLIQERASLRQEITALKHRQREAAAPPPPPPHSRDRTGREEITELLDRQDIRWTDWEKEFLESVARWRGPLTSRQEESLNKIRAKARQQDAARKAAAGIWG